MKKNSKKDTINLFLSAFLILVFIFCSNFFGSYLSARQDTLGVVLTIFVYAIFGALMFYATRVGDGKQIKRFSPLTLIFMVLPTLYIIVAAIIPGLPFHDVLYADNSLTIVSTLSAVAFGYGIPYSFLSGYEISDDEEETETEISEETEEMLEGGVEADLQSLDTNENDEEEIDWEEV